MRVTNYAKQAVGFLSRPFVAPVKHMLQGQRLAGAMIGMQVGAKLGARTRSFQGTAIGATIGFTAGLAFGSWSRKQALSIKGHKFSGEGILSSPYTQAALLLGAGTSLAFSKNVSLPWVKMYSLKGKIAALAKTYIGFDIGMTGIHHGALHLFNQGHRSKTPIGTNPPTLFAARFLANRLASIPGAGSFFREHKAGTAQVFSFAMPLAAELTTAASFVNGRRRLIDTYNTQKNQLTTHLANAEKRIPALEKNVEIGRSKITKKTEYRTVTQRAAPDEDDIDRAIARLGRHDLNSSKYNDRLKDLADAEQGRFVRTTESYDVVEDSDYRLALGVLTKVQEDIKKTKTNLTVLDEMLALSQKTAVQKPVDALSHLQWSHILGGGNGTVGLVAAHQTPLIKKT